MEIVLNLSETTSNDLSQNPDSDSLQSPYSNTAAPLLKDCFTFDSIHHVNGHLNKLLREKFNDATVIISVVILILINLVVIAGNILVILSVLTSNKLRTVTNFFIVSLAVADFLVGIAVLPYSLTLEILDTWIFGEIWCQGWLVIDVWMCTASILNLCAISVDRYLAVTQPVRYRSLMTARRAKFIIAAVWILSFIICFPGLVVQTKSLVSRNALSKQQNLSTYKLPSILPDSFAIPNTKAPHRLITPSTSASLTASALLQNPSPNDLTKDPNLSSINPFRASETLLLHGPKAISNNFNITVYTQSTVSNNSNSLYPAPKSNTPLNSSNTTACNSQPVQCALFTNKSYVIYSAFGSFFIPMFVMIFFYWRIYLVAIRTTRALKRGYRTTKSSGDGTNEERLTLRIHRGYATDDNLGDKCHIKSTVQKSQGKTSKTSGTKSKTPVRYKSRIPITIYKTSKPSQSNLTVNNLSIAGSAKCNTLSPGVMVENNGKNRRNSPGCQSTLSLPSSSSPSSSREGSAKSNKVALSRLSKRTSKYQAKRFHAETKAAKTVGIIVGGFIVCWLPFFTVYLTKAFCVNCIPDLLFSIFFWLGYCNSMINPCIYGLFSKDFRRAFKNIICRCKFQEETSVSSLIRQIHMPTFFEDMPEEIEAKQESQEY